MVIESFVEGGRRWGGNGKQMGGCSTLKHWALGRKSQQILGPLLLFVDGLSEERIRNQ